MKAKKYPSDEALLKKMFPSTEEKEKTWIPYDELSTFLEGYPKKESQLQTFGGKFTKRQSEICFKIIEDQMKEIFEKEYKPFSKISFLGKESLELVEKAIRDEAKRNGITYEGEDKEGSI